MTVVSRGEVPGKKMPVTRDNIIIIIIIIIIDVTTALSGPRPLQGFSHIHFYP